MAKRLPGRIVDEHQLNELRTKCLQLADSCPRRLYVAFLRDLIFDLHDRLETARAEDAEASHG